MDVLRTPIEEPPTRVLPRENSPPDCFHSISCVSLCWGFRSLRGATRAPRPRPRKGSSPLDPRRPFEKGWAESFFNFAFDSLIKYLPYCNLFVIAKSTKIGYTVIVEKSRVYSAFITNTKTAVYIFTYPAHIILAQQCGCRQMSMVSVMCRREKLNGIPIHAFTIRF